MAKGPVPISERCKADAWTQGYMHRCFNRATLREEGKQYCHIHAPSYVAQKRAKQKVAWDEWVALMAQGQADDERKRAENARKLAAFDGLVEACEKLLVFLGDLDEGRDEAQTLAMAEAKAAILKAKGGTDV